MPKGMQLKSDGFASDLYDPERKSTIKRYCTEHGIPYDDLLVPVNLDTFVNYGLAFQQERVPTLEDKQVVGLTRIQGGFRVTLDDRTKLDARKVVVATGISYIANIPPVLERLDSAHRSHTSDHHELGHFAGKKVIVVGGGSSATDIAVLIHEAGGKVELVARHPVGFHSPPRPEGRPLLERIRRPHLGLGPSLRSTFYTALPGAFHALPRSKRLAIVRRHLGPVGGYFVKDRLVGSVPIHVGYSLEDARYVDGQATVVFRHKDGSTLTREADHVISATGYKVSLEKMPFFDEALRRQVALEENYPRLSRKFESSVAGLHFIGVHAAGSFGPLMRFALGAGYTSKVLSAHLARNRVEGRVAASAQVASSQ